MDIVSFYFDGTISVLIHWLDIFKASNLITWQHKSVYCRILCHFPNPCVLNRLPIYDGQHAISSLFINKCLCRCCLWPHDDVIKWKHFPRYWPFGRGIHRSPVNSPHKGQWRGALMFSLIYIWINGWVNNREAGDLRRHHTHDDVTVMRR